MKRVATRLEGYNGAMMVRAKALQANGALRAHPMHIGVHNDNVFFGQLLAWRLARIGIGIGIGIAQ